MPMKDLILENLRSQRVSGAYCDLKIELGCHNVWIHSAIVCPFSRYLDMHKENVNVKIHVHNECLQCMETLLDVMYGQDVNVPDSHLDHIREYCRLLMLTDGMLEPLTIIGLDLESVPNLVTPKEVKREAIIDDHFEYYQETKKLRKSRWDNVSPRETIFEAIKYEEVQPPERIVKRERPDEENDSLPRKKYCQQNESICLVCDFQCPQVDALYRHLQETNHCSKLCSICMEALPDGETLEDHLPSHSHLAPFPCLKCGLRFSERSSLTDHIATHTLRCLHCDLSFSTLETLYRHLLKTNHGRTCSICNKMLHNEESLEEHLSLHSDLVPFACPHCDQKFKLESKLIDHIAGHNSKICCLECGRKFRAPTDLCQHLLSTNHSSSVCSVCDKILSYGETLKRHLNLHKKEKHNIFSCLQLHCNQNFSELDDLYRHLQMTNHSSKVCSICKEPLPKWVTLKEHLTMHLNVAPFACSHCDLRFKIKKMMLDHKKCH